MFDRRLIAADLLKLRRRRGMLAVSLLLTVVSVALAFIVMAIQHATDPVQFGPAGGVDHYLSTLSFVGGMTFTVGTIIGATAGTQDLESGVFRDLVATGRSRTALYASRVVAAWAVVLPVVGITAVLTGVASVGLAGSLEAPGAGALLAGTTGILVAGAFSAAVAVGVSVLVGSRAQVIGILLAFYFAISPLLIAMGTLGDLRQAIPEVAATRIGDLPVSGDVPVGLLTAVLVITAWSVVALGLGAWRTRNREI